MKVAIRLAAAGVALAISGAAIAADLPTADPAEVGMSNEKLARVDALLEDKIAAGDFPGAVLLVARDGKIAHLVALGKRTPDGEAMTVDSIFRIYSMTKPVTSVVALMLVEEGQLDLAAPVSR
jgi:CubicO group peptidase (beta-lactamase class C family)